MRPIIIMLALLAATLTGAEASETEGYTLRELLERSELIVAARTVGDEAELVRGGLVVEEILKGEAPPPVRFVVEGPPVPRDARAVWFLWRRSGDGAWIVDNPQNAYDMSHLTLIRRALEDPSNIRPEYFLRREDELRAQAARLRRELRELADLAPGEAVRGLALSVEAISSRLLSGESLYLRYTLTNVSERSMLVCLAETECWHAVTVRTVEAASDLGAEDLRSVIHSALRLLGIRPPPPPVSLVNVVRAGGEPLPGEAGLGLGLLVTEHDYTVLPPGRSISTTIAVSTDNAPSLRVPGRVEVRGAYSYRHPSAPLVALPGNPWEGALASESVEITVVR